MTATTGAESLVPLQPYAPRVLLEWLHREPATRAHVLDGSVVFADISGFTKLSERLASRGRVGAEELTDAINRCFEALLAVAYDDGAGLLKFGGDATLLLFTGDDHARRACRAAGAMRRALRELGAFETSGHRVTLRISLGVHSGAFTAYVVGESHRELLLTGPGFTTVVDMEATAEAGEVVVSPATAALLPRRAVGRAKGSGFLLAGALGGAPSGRVGLPGGLSTDVVAQTLPTAVRRHLSSAVDEPEHRRVTVAFLHFDGTDARAGDRDGLARDLDELVAQVQRSADRHGVCFLGSDVDHDGGKIILVAGAPTATGADEQAMLLALREVLDAGLAVPVRVGLNTGPVFVGSVGPAYRRTFTVMGDAVNLAARVMAKARTGQLLATDAVLGGSEVRFATTALEPFLVKGKSAPVQAHEVGPATSGEASRRAAPRLVGREVELATLTALLDRARAGHGALVELVGEAGLGKSRLVEELVRRADGVRVLSTACAAYQSLTPYFPFRTLLRQAMGVPLGDSPADAGAALLALLHERAPELLPWAPLLAIPLGGEVPTTSEVDRLGERFVTARLQHVVTAFLGVLLEGPTLVAVDDVHWSDDASADLLHRIARDVHAGPWLVCVTRRDAGTGFVASDVPSAVSLRPEELSADAALELAQSLVDAEPGAQRLSPHDLVVLVARSGGNPLYLEELVAGAAAAGGVDALPNSVEALITARIDRLSPADRALLRRLSVFGQSVELDLLRAALGPEAPDPDDPVWARLSEVVQVEGGTLRFEHGLVRDGAYGGLPFRLRRRLHARIAKALESRTQEPEPVASLLSLHFFHAHSYDKAWRYSCLAAARARAVHANVEAVELYERAAASAREGADVGAAELAIVQEAAGDLHSRLGKYAEADLAYRDAHARLAGEVVDQVRLLVKRGEIRQRFGQYAAALRWLGRARREAERLEPAVGHPLLGTVYMSFAGVAKDQGRHRLAITWCRRAIAVAAPIRDKATLANAYSVHDGLCAVLGRLDEVRFGERALALYGELDDLRGQGLAHTNLGLLSIMQGRWDEGLEHWEKAQAALRAVGDEVKAADTDANVAEARLEQGRLDEAERYVRQAVRVWAAAGDRALSAYGARLLARVEARRGDVSGAIARLEAARADFEAAAATEEALETSARIAEALVLAGRADEALGLGRSLLQPLQDAPHLAPLVHRVVGLAHAQLGDDGEAQACLRRSLHEAQAAGTDIEAAHTLRALVRLAHLSGRPVADLEDRCLALHAGLGVVAPADPPLAAVAAVPA